ncbi:hypothetical protein NL676_003319 [Syzygium grande]|nr:hypothetical protein NL676_003319 [Syzygium grande]
MTTPRCGMPDIINETARMGPGKKGRNLHGLSSFNAVSHYQFFKGNPKWPTSQYHLTYGFFPGSPVAVAGPILGFLQPFARGNHGDGVQNSFDGPGGILAHASALTGGLFHYDADERCAVGPAPGSGAHDPETVALHKIGHLLGLDHSRVEGAIMYESIPAGTIKGLHEDDIQGIKALYNF